MLSGPNFSKRPQIDLKLGILSRYREENGFFADALGLATVTLPEGWRERLVPYHDDQGNIIALCADRHDVAVSKFIAGREKDLEFLTSAIDSGLIEAGSLLERLKLAFDKVENDVILDRIERLSSIWNRPEFTTILLAFSKITREYISNALPPHRNLRHRYGFARGDAAGERA